MNPRNLQVIAKVIIASAFGLGLSPVAPGTFGALLGVISHIFIVLFLPVKLQLLTLIIVFLTVCIANNLLTPWAETYWECEDPGNFVLDEVAGYLLVPILFWPGMWWQTALWGFIFFRIFDIIKLPPARQIDRNWHGAWGILLDDLVSAVYAVILMYCLWWLGREFSIKPWFF